MYAGIGALLLADGRLPTGGYAHSGGLEPALAAGLDLGDVPAYMRARLQTVGLVDASAAVLARRSDGLADLQAALLARIPSEPLRAASTSLGRGLTRLARRLWPEHHATHMLEALPSAPLRPIALGAIGAILELEERQIARISLYDDAQTVAAAALKLLPVDPADAARWVLESAPIVEESVLLAVATSRPQQLPALTAPLIEQWSLDHSARTRRIFVA
ncbi:urease accessory protein [Antricoccus suffuscus]|uniref:Urease accessory protein n=1 Tax=Antricoccus suffuscus TaxID=1629062 RepID=A0A2T1A636_9ACTN|nr:urease accessory UreF family protein [Antricoccus suffuscus]PRZ43937.1 urease accessory protein [Antricoccus suffuscus]